MGYGDQIIATGIAKGAAAKGQRVAFGQGGKIIWDHRSEEIFRGNPNIAPPGLEGTGENLNWYPFYKGHRIYNRHDRTNNKWIWNEDWRCEPGEFFFTPDEDKAAIRYGSNFILVEPHVEHWKPSASNKDWGLSKYQTLVERLAADGFDVCQFYRPGASLLHHVRPLKTRDFRDAVSILRHARMYVGPEGGLHHAAAAVGIQGVVIFGAWIPPSVTGYDIHTNIALGKACGELSPCLHCQGALKNLKVNTVYVAVNKILEGTSARADTQKGGRLS